MNHLHALGADTWELPQHAHVVVHDATEGEELLTIYDCGAAQKPPSAQVTGNLVRIEATYDHLPQPNGYIAKLREPATLERQSDDHWVIRAHNTQLLSDS